MSKDKKPNNDFEVSSKDNLNKKLTENNNEFFLSVAFNYGSRNEIVETINKINLSENNYLTEKQFSENLSSNKFPDPDIIIRTGGQKRLSNFLLWESAYSELFFLDVFWPEFSEKDLTLVINEFSKRKRNFGT